MSVVILCPPVFCSALLRVSVHTRSEVFSHVGGGLLILKTDQILASLICSVQLEASSSKIDPAPF